ncbi:recombinase family protein [Alteraurantiacibacter buctensis]|nr:recombinase family protein [Alteraurantiacibacter buctensis]
MGGAVPLGYQVQERKLVIDEEEAATVRHIFSRYAALGSGGDLLDELRLCGIRTKRHIRKDGLVRGGIPFTRGSLFHLLKNRVYRGEIVHKDTAYPGEHEAIIDAGLWESVQQRIVENTVDRKLRRKAREASLLSGIIFDGHGRKMCPSHTVRKAKRYRYYVTHPDKVIDDMPQWRRSAFDIEKRVIGALADYLEDQQAVRKLVGSSDASQLATAITRCQRAAEQIRTSTFHRRTKVPALVARVDLGDDDIGISLSSDGFAVLLGTPIDAERLPRLTVQVARVRRGNEIKLILTEGATTEADDTLVSLLREAMAARNEMLAEHSRGICQLASATGRCSKRMTRLVRLSWLAPEIVDAILAGRQPRDLTARTLLSAELPMDWPGQKAALRF